jgi:hypothetical protein
MQGKSETSGQERYSPRISILGVGCEANEDSLEIFTVKETHKSPRKRAIAPVKWSADKISEYQTGGNVYREQDECLL